MRAKETLQLRHQLSTSGLNLLAATYDTRRHHVLTFDSHPQRPHTLRLFSLRRELRSAFLFDKCDETNPEKLSTIERQPSFEVQRQRPMRTKQSDIKVHVPKIWLHYSATLDVFVCVYSSAIRSKDDTLSHQTTTYSIALLDSTSLRQLLVHQGPKTHLLHCAHYDPQTDRLVLASHLHEQVNDNTMSPSASVNIIEILQLSNRLDDRTTIPLVGGQEQSSLTLQIETVQAPLLCPDTLTLLCGSKGLRSFFGAASNEANEATVVLVWRQHEENGGTIALVNRIKLLYRITAMAVSPCGDWLLAGVHDGSLKIWSVSGSSMNGLEQFTCEAAPYDATGPGVGEAKVEVISSIEIVMTHALNLADDEDATSTDMIVIVAERDTGVVRHWNLSVITNDQNECGGDAVQQRCPRMKLVGYYDSSRSKNTGSNRKCKTLRDHNTVGPPLKTLTMCATVDMGSCMENLLLVVRDNIVHVLKIQTALYVLQEFAPPEEVLAVRALSWQESFRIVSLSSAVTSNFRIFRMDDVSKNMPSSEPIFFIRRAGGRVCAIEVITNEMVQKSLVVLAWCCGTVDLYDVEREKCVMTLQDKHIVDQISALSVVTYQRKLKPKIPLAYDKAGVKKVLSPLMYWDSDQCHAKYVAESAASDTCEEGVVCRAIVIVGTESGNLYGWQINELWHGDCGFQLVSKADTRIQSAHLSHVIQLAHVSGNNGKRAVLASVGDGGIVKLWSVPFLKLYGYVNSVVDGFSATPSCIELMRDQDRRLKRGKFWVSVGYDDGRLAVWCIDVNHFHFQRLEVSAKHERRITKICRVSNLFVPAKSMEFMSCSFDMTVIQWQISNSGSVQEKRYFEVGAAIVDMIVINEQVIVASPHEVCSFAFAFRKNESKIKIKKKNNMKTIKHTSKHQEFIADAVAPLVSEGVLTNCLKEDPTKLTTPFSRIDYSKREDFLLHHSSAVVQKHHGLEADSSCVSPLINFKEYSSTTLEQSDALLCPRMGINDGMALYTRGGERTKPLSRTSIEDDILLEFLQEFITRQGTGGTIAAKCVPHFLASRPELPRVKRINFALAKSLKDLKLTAQTRVDSQKGLQILKMLFTMKKNSHQSFDSQTMAHKLKHEDHTSKKVRKQHVCRSQRARRKPVVTFNLLGEKYVRWKEELLEHGESENNRFPYSLTRNFSVRTTHNSNKRDAEDDPLRYGITNSALQGTSRSEFTTTTVACSLTTSLADAGTSLPLNDLFTTASPDDIIEHEIDGGNEKDQDSNTWLDYNESSKDQDHDNTTQPIVLTKANGAVAASDFRYGTIATKYAEPNESRANNAENALMNNIRLPSQFQPFWTKGYCWCRPAPHLHINWTSNDTDEIDKVTPTKRTLTCKICHKRLHTVELPSVGFITHFSRQAMFEIIVKLYSKLSATAHTRLFKTFSTRNERPLDCSIHTALFEMFLTTYGVRNTTELKLKLFFVSMCQWLPDYDAFAVFGELLGLHQTESAENYDQAPTALVALCVCCYSWLYSRQTVVNGDPIIGYVHGQERDAESAIASTKYTDSTTHWQFVRIEHALLCAQDNLLYPLVSPDFLTNVMLFMQDYTQRVPTRCVRADTPDIHDNTHRCVDQAACWIEVHRFLRLVVGEWKHQNAQFRTAERLLFIYPQQSTNVERDWLEKLRLFLNCFVFYDHERVGVMTVRDFDTLMLKLRYLWTEESKGIDPSLTVTDDIFASTLMEIKNRFIDRNHDGQLCYLDFWVMLYMIGIKSHGFIRFQDIPILCRSYRLEVSPELTDIIWNYMVRSCTVVLPKGLCIGKSSMDHKAEHQHQRRVGGLHDGTFHFAKTLTQSLSTQDLLRCDATKKLGLFLDGSVPATRLTASTTALDRYQTLLMEDNVGSADCHRNTCKPIVFGHRPSGPTPKSVAPLRVSLMGNYDLLSDTGNCVDNSCVQQMETSYHNAHLQREYTNSYIQFPEVIPVRTSLLAPAKVTSRRKMRRFLLKKKIKKEDSDLFEDSMIQKQEQEERSSPVKASVTSSSGMVVREEDQEAEEYRVQSFNLETRFATPDVVIPMVLPEMQANLELEHLMRQLSLEIVHRISEQISLEDVVAQCEDDMIKSVSDYSIQEESLVDDESKGGGSMHTACVEQLSKQDITYLKEGLNNSGLSVDGETFMDGDSREQGPLNTIQLAIAPPVNLRDSVIDSLSFESEEAKSIIESASDENFESQDASDEELSGSFDKTPDNPKSVDLDKSNHFNEFQVIHKPDFAHSVAVINTLLSTTIKNVNEDNARDGDHVETKESFTNPPENLKQLDEPNYGNKWEKATIALDRGGNNTADNSLTRDRRKRLDEDAEQALYGERVEDVLDGGIVFTPEIEAIMQRKWQQFFDDSESRMFSAMRTNFENMQTRQRETDERQIMLSQKWQEQRDQNSRRLQHSRRRSSLFVPLKQDLSSDVADAGFRTGQVHRESCQEFTKELQFGVSVRREAYEAKDTHFFQFSYRPEGFTSILTIEMHVLRGNAEVFMSTSTKQPCATDFMWRSTERLMKEPDEKHRIVLYPHDLVQIQAASDAGVTTAFEANHVVFYLSVVAMESKTAFTLTVMPSGQKTQPSQAMQTVDYLIDRFNMMTRFYHENRTGSFTPINGLLPTENSADADADADAIQTTGMQQKPEKISVDKAAFARPSDGYSDFVQDDDQPLQMPHLQIPSNISHDASSYGSKRRVTLHGERQKLHKVKATRLQQKLAPLHHKLEIRSEKRATTGALNNILTATKAPRPVAYSITKLDPLPRSQRYK